MMPKNGKWKKKDCVTTFSKKKQGLKLYIMYQYVLTENSRKKIINNI